MGALDWAEQVIALERVMSHFREAERIVNDDPHMGGLAPLFEGVDALRARIAHCESMIEELRPSKNGVK